MSNQLCNVPNCRWAAEFKVEIQDKAMHICGIHWVPWTLHNSNILQFCTITSLKVAE